MEQFEITLKVTKEMRDEIDRQAKIHAEGLTEYHAKYCLALGLHHYRMIEVKHYEELMVKARDAMGESLDEYQ